MKTLIIGQSSDGYGCLFKDLGQVTHAENPDAPEIEDHNLICFVGGNDVDPSLYEHKKLPTTQSLVRLDLRHYEIFKHAQLAQIPAVGICKGAQQLCVFHGGSLYQKVTNHTTNHTIDIQGIGKNISVTSSHQQMMNLRDVKVPFKILGSCTPISSRYVEWPAWEEQPVEHADIGPVEPEIVLFEGKTPSLAVQPHPEWMYSASEGYLAFQTLLRKYLIPNIIH